MATPPLKPIRILVVDDEPIVCDSIRMLLAFDGHTVSTANSAEQALSVFKPDQFDALITDYAMPGMKGSELATEIRRQAPDLPVLLVTAYAEMLSSWGADLSNVDCVVSKPFRLEVLRNSLADAMRGAGRPG
ncbi:MAG: response regulator [Verrucomicrobia bacterium]|jgi:CheY-like chemotaxis protein|nr:response regulator [Verrucomicrobiota bacterium]